MGRPATHPVWLLQETQHRPQHIIRLQRPLHRLLRSPQQAILTTNAIRSRCQCGQLSSPSSWHTGPLPSHARSHSGRCVLHWGNRSHCQTAATSCSSQSAWSDSLARRPSSRCATAALPCTTAPVPSAFAIPPWLTVAAGAQSRVQRLSCVAYFELHESSETQLK